MEPLLRQIEQLYRLGFTDICLRNSETNEKIELICCIENGKLALKVSLASLEVHLDDLVWYFHAR